MKIVLADPPDSKRGTLASNGLRLFIYDGR